MKKHLVILIIMVAGIFSLSAASPEQYFSSLSTKEGFDYSYTSPSMLKMMGDKVVNAEYNIRAKDITSIETIRTTWNGTDQELWDAIRKLKKDLKLETLSTKKENMYRFDVLGTLSGNKRYITRMLVITQNTGANVTVVYIEGKIPINEMMLQF